MSHFLDLSTIYSDDENTLKTLRAHYGGLFQMDPKNVLPLDSQGAYTTGDIRFQQTPILALTYSLFYRMHNVIAINLQEINPHWTDDEIFQECRRLNIAIYQHIIYNEWLPLVMSKYSLVLRYNDKC